MEPIRCLARKPELFAGQAGGILKYRRLVLLDSYVFRLIKVKRTRTVYKSSPFRREAKVFQHAVGFMPTVLTFCSRKMVKIPRDQLGGIRNKAQSEQRGAPMLQKRIAPSDLIDLAESGELVELIE